MTKIIPVILSGGSGTRLWPLSTDVKPKQFLALTSGRSMFADTLERIADKERFGPALVIGAERHADLMQAELVSLGLADARVILEPIARNTSPAIALAALAVGGSDAVLLVMPSDHVIGDLPAFLAAVDTALPAAKAGWLVTFGITPTGPETGFGYIRMGNPLNEAPAVRQVDRFIEKPSRDKAEAMLAEGSYAWNAGIFLFRADRYLAELAMHAPAMDQAARASLDGMDLDAQQIRPDAGLFAACPSDSIDYAVMERSQQVAIVPVACGWSDVGSWDALASLGSTDEYGNSVSGSVVTLNTSDSMIRGDGIKVVVNGVDNLIIVANKTHVMILPRGRSQEVKKMAEMAASDDDKTIL